MQELFQSTGHIRYGQDGRLVLDVDQGISDYYRSLIPKCKNVQRPRWNAHVTIVRIGKEIPRHKGLWRKYSWQKVDFVYDPYIYEDGLYFWLNVFSKKLEHIRRELGLPMMSTFAPPKGYDKSFHITIANKKQ